MKFLITSFALVATTVAYAQPHSVADDIAFWSGQMVEHAEFASGFAKDPQLKQKGLEISKKFKAIKNNDAKTFLALSDEINKYQSNVRSDVKKNYSKKDAAIPLDLLAHMDLETDYAKKKAQGKQLSKHEEATFWSEEHEGEAKVMAALMTPKAPALKKEAEEISQTLKNNAHFWKGSLEVVENANTELDSIGTQIEKDPSKTTIPAKLAEHEKRERARAAQTFARLEAQK